MTDAKSVHSATSSSTASSLTSSSSLRSASSSDKADPSGEPGRKSSRRRTPSTRSRRAAPRMYRMWDWHPASCSETPVALASLLMRDDPVYRDDFVDLLPPSIEQDRATWSAHHHAAWQNVFAASEDDPAHTIAPLGLEFSHVSLWSDVQVALDCLRAAVGVHRLRISVLGAVGHDKRPTTQQLASAMALHTPLRALHFRARADDMHPVLDAVAASCASLRFLAFDVWGSMTSMQYVCILTAVAALRRLHSIDLPPMPPAVWPAFCRLVRESLPALRVIRLAYHTIDAAAMRALVAALQARAATAPVRGLSFLGCTLSDDALLALLAQPAGLSVLRGFTALELTRMPLTRVVVDALVTAALPVMRHLQRVNFLGADLSLSDAERILAAVAVPGALHVLGLDVPLTPTSTLGPALTKAALQMPRLHALPIKVLNQYDPVSSVLLKHLLPAWTRLRRLDLGNWVLDDASAPDGESDAMVLLKSLREMHQLQTLKMPRRQRLPDLLQQVCLRVLPHTPRLRDLDLGSVPDASVLRDFVAVLPRLPLLRFLSLGDVPCQPSHALILLLRALQQFQHLQLLEIYVDSDGRRIVWPEGFLTVAREVDTSMVYGVHTGMLFALPAGADRDVHAPLSLPSLFALAADAVLSGEAVVARTDVPPGLHPSDLRLSLKCCVVCHRWRRPAACVPCVSAARHTSGLCLVRAVRCAACFQQQPILEPAEDLGISDVCVL